ncbi:MAG: DNA polymerase/3'-5' exonuclease PolX [Planctomycetota bacterium]
MGFNADIADAFETLAGLLELTGANRFKVNAYAKAARVIEGLTENLASIEAEKLTAIEGIGKGIAEKIVEQRTTGSIEELDGLLAELPPGLLGLMDIPGLGPKTVRMLWQQLNVTDRDGLTRAIEDGSILALPRMGEKAVEKIRKSMAFASKSAERLPIGLAWPIAARILEELRRVPGVQRAEAAGSLRRGAETIGDLDILAVAEEPEAAREAFCSMQGVTDILARGETKCAVRISVGNDLGRWSGVLGASDQTVGVDLRLVPEASFGAALMYFTGSKDHNVRLRERAQKIGSSLNEYGITPVGTDDVEPRHGETEAAVFEALGVPWVPPELREDRGELGTPPPDDLITLEDIQAELHAHTTASDGLMSLDQLVEAAIARGFHTIAVTDHSKSSIQANGLSVERLREQREAIEDARDRFDDRIRILAGSEVDIYADGSLDYDDDILEWLDIVVASPHAALSQKPADATKRLLKAIEHPAVNVLGHPTGRIIGRRSGLEPAMDELIAAAVEHDVALEINSHWLRLDLRDTHVRAAVEAGALIAIDCDVHAAEDFDNLRFGVMTARRGWLPRDRCVNTWDADALQHWLRIAP